MTYPPPQGRGMPTRGQYPAQNGPVEGDGGQRPSPQPGAPRPEAARYPGTPPYPGSQPYPASPPPHLGAPRHPVSPHYPVPPQQSGQLPGWDSPFVHMQTRRSAPNRLLIAGIAAGVVAIVALGAVLLVALSSAVADSSSTVATDTAAPRDTGDTAPDGSGQQGQGGEGQGGDGQGDDDSSGASADPGQTAAVRAAMQRYIDAYNSRDLNQIKAATCTGLRNQVRAPRASGTVVLDSVSGVQVSGDVAQSLVETHLTDGSQTSRTTTDKASFTNEQGTWYFCPNAQPSYST